MYRNIGAKTKAGQNTDLNRAIAYLQCGRAILEERARNEEDCGYRADIEDLAEDVTNILVQIEQWGT
jgi:hypothetical protein